MKAVRSVNASNRVPYLQIRSVKSNNTLGSEKEGKDGVSIGNALLILYVPIVLKELFLTTTQHHKSTSSLKNTRCIRLNNVECTIVQEKK
jgi:hypothetical protein